MATDDLASMVRGLSLIIPNGPMHRPSGGPVWVLPVGNGGQSEKALSRLAQPRFRRFFVTR